MPELISREEVPVDIDYYGLTLEDWDDSQVPVLFPQGWEAGPFLQARPGRLDVLTLMTVPPEFADHRARGVVHGGGGQHAARARRGAGVDAAPGTPPTPPPDHAATRALPPGRCGAAVRWR